MPAPAYNPALMDELARALAQAALDELIRDMLCENRSGERIDDAPADERPEPTAGS